MASASISTLLILGAGGHGRVVADAALLSDAWDRVLASDEDPARCRDALLPGVEAILFDEARELAGPVHVAVGDGADRERLSRPFMARLATVTHTRATVSRHARVGAGSFLAAASIVAPGATVGMGAIVNHGAIVDHDCTVGDFTHIAPQAALGGGVRIGARVLLGSGAHVLPGLSVCDGALIGSGAVVCRDIVEPGTYAGVPARRLR